MDHFNSGPDGYNKTQVNEFVDYVIEKTEEHVATIRSQQDEIKRLYEELDKYKRLENTMNYANNEIKELAKKQADLILNEAKDNANKIVNDALIKSQKQEMEQLAFTNNVKIMKKKIRNTLLEQLNNLEEIEIL